MVVATAATRLPWDAFLEGGPTAALAAFREMEWPAVQRELGLRGFQVQEGEEPHWVGPGTAIYWQQEQGLRVVEREVDGRKVRTVEGTQGEWVPSGPLPASNASVIAHYLGKGFLLRPPGGAALPTGLPLEEEPLPAAPPLAYTCNRHAKGEVRFATYKAYLRHCQYMREEPEQAPPERDLRRARKSPYHCPVHVVGFATLRAAQNHVKACIRRGVKHPTLSEMQSKKEKEAQK